MVGESEKRHPAEVCVHVHVCLESDVREIESRFPKAGPCLSLTASFLPGLPSAANVVAAAIEAGGRWVTSCTYVRGVVN